MQTAVDLIGAVPLFERLDASLLERIDAITEQVTAEPDQTLSEQGAMPECLHVLLDGQVALSSTAADGTTALVEVLHPIDHFVMASVLTRLPYLMTARTVTRCRLLAIDAAGLMDLVEHEAPLANTLLRSVSREFRTMVRQVRDLKLRTAAQRLGCYLLARVKDGEAVNADFRLPFDKGLLAARLGCRQENLSRAFATLRAYGVETHGSRVILHDIPRLNALAVPDDPGDPEGP
ncbi:MAG TPA: cyclic nucleotide-binding domain-containing protein [Acetobacteraceae bacterium]|jgi:CRP/FNR family transcriptional activator FtrB|nr:cyclic nucleotide-binding domain-containing protein [Acetobacteraceae bacterium]